MSLQYLADIESDIGPHDGPPNDVLSTIWLDSGVVISGTLNGQLQAWHASTGKLLGKTETKAHSIGVHALSYSTERNLLLSSALDGTAALWSADGLAERVSSAAQSDPELSAEAGVEQNSSSLSQSFPLQLVASFAIGPRRETDEETISITGKTQPFTALLHPSGTMFAATGREATVTMYSCEEDKRGKALFILTPQQDTSAAPKTTKESRGKKNDFGMRLAFGNEGRHLAVGTQKGKVHVFDIDSGLLLKTISDNSSAVRALHYAANENILIGYDDGTVQTYDVREPGYRFDSQGEASYGAEDFSAASSSQYTLPSTSQPSSTFSRTNSANRYTGYSFVRSLDTRSMTLTDVKASPDGRILATTSIDGSIRIWDPTSRPPSTLCSIREGAEVWSFAWKPVREGGGDENPFASRAIGGLISAAAQSARTASVFVVGSADGKVRWYRNAGTGES